MKLTQVDFQERRDRLAAQMGPNSIANCNQPSGDA